MGPGCYRAAGRGPGRGVPHSRTACAPDPSPRRAADARPPPRPRRRRPRRPAAPRPPGPLPPAGGRAPAGARPRAAGARVARLATVRPDGAPHAVPVCFALAGERAYTAVDHKPKRTARLARLANIAAEPRVA